MVVKPVTNTLGKIYVLMASQKTRHFAHPRLFYQRLLLEGDIQTFAQTERFMKIAARFGKESSQVPLLLSLLKSSDPLFKP